MKGLFKSKPRTPAELVRHLHELLVFFIGNNPDIRQSKQKEKMSDLAKDIQELRSVLYGVDGAEPHPEACAIVTQEFFKAEMFRLLIDVLPKMEVGARQDAIHVLANLQRQRVNSQIVASTYLENHMDIMDILIAGYEDEEMGLIYGAILKGCVRHQVVTRYILEPEHIKKFFKYIQCPNFEIASDAAAVFKELLTRHRSTVAEFLSTNYEWFFQEYNSELLQSSNYVTRRHAVRLLGEMLLDRSNTGVMVRYVSSLDNLRILMNLLRESNKTIQIDAFHVFKLFVANENKPPEIVAVLVGNRSKLLRFLGDFSPDREDEQFEADKAQIVNEIATLKPQSNGPTLGKCESFHLGS